jgi:hypothetical protein
MHRVRFHIRGEAIALHPIQRKAGRKVAKNLAGDGEMECWSSGVVEWWKTGALKQEITEATER